MTTTTIIASAGTMPGAIGPLIAVLAIAAAIAAVAPIVMPAIVRPVMPPGARNRARGTRGRLGNDVVVSAAPPRIGIDATIAAVIARVKGGGTAVEAFEEQGGVRFATPRVTVARAATVLRVRAKDDESETDVATAARHLAAACRLSERTGCELARCLEAVASDQSRARRAAELKRQTFAMPKATIRLLSTLPAVTVALGELLGARPVAFLFGSPQGLLCLGLGGLWYAAGLVWTHRMLTSFDDAGGDTDADLPITLAMLHAALRQGASIPGALIAVGEAIERPALDDTGRDRAKRDGTRRDGPKHDGPKRRGAARDLPTCLRAAGYALTRGATWHEAWIGAGAGGLPLESVRDCLGEAWTHGVSPTARLELAIERYGRDETAAIERAAAELSVHLLAPTGLCFLPAFVLIGVIPAIVSFAL